MQYNKITSDTHEYNLCKRNDNTEVKIGLVHPLDLKKPGLHVFKHVNGLAKKHTYDSDGLAFTNLSFKMFWYTVSYLLLCS